MKNTSISLKSVLVANRGEIACRVISTLRQNGIEAVAIYHAAERGARHVRMADRAVEISGPTPVAAHLDAQQIIACAADAGVEGIHPGYGFLSENAEFAAAVDEAGLTFIGPSAESIALMGDKIRSREFAEANGVPVAPSIKFDGDLGEFTSGAAKIGFPLLIKATAGGGGKGMSIVSSEAELAERVRIAASEAERYFGNGQIYAERYITAPRHIEVQVFGDGKGGAVHLFERECSIQRRFQKVIEEAPAPGLEADLRTRICEAALRLTRAAKYQNAGTVEFILAPDGAFYFLEMNTRLQVEHPVTELITGRDLVQLQLDVASGLGVPDQSTIEECGHAIECRICAEDPALNFLPETGRIVRYAEPSGEGIRFDSGLTEGDEISSNFDPMLAKLITHGATRGEAIARMESALHDLVILGVVTNTDYLARIMRQPEFLDGMLHTGFVEEHADALAAPPLTEDEVFLALAAAAMQSPAVKALIHDVPEPYATMGSWRNG
jgi:acetyl/propionyl-CoA carboxylase alpha subunit